MATKHLIRIGLLCLVALQGGLGTVCAQGPGEGEEPITVAPSGRLDLTFGQLGYDTKQLNRERDDQYYWIGLPGNFRVLPTGNYLDLTTYHLPEVPDRPAVLKVTVNGRLLSTIPMTASNAVSNTVRIALPPDLLRTGSNSIRIGLDTSTTCEDPGAIVDVFIDPTSILSFSYQQNPYPTDLSRYPLPFTEESLFRIPVTLVLPDHPTPNDLTAAATVAAGLGQMSGGAIDLTAVLASELSPDMRGSHHLIVVGKPGDNAVLSNLALPMLIDDTRLQPGQGVLEEILSPWNGFRLVLVVSGLDDEAVSKASHALNRQAHFLGMQGTVAVVTALRAVPEPVAPRTPSMTLAALGYGDQVAYGAQPQGFTYDFTLPLGWRLEAPPFFVCKFSHADILDPNASAMDIALNGVLIGSTLLNTDNAGEGELTVSLPRRLLKVGRNRLAIGIEMNFPVGTRDKCMDLADERAWTVISSESEVFLPYETVALSPDLSRLPYPFSQSTGFDHTLFVLPDQPSSKTVSNLIRLAVLLGSSSRQEGVSARVACASDVDEEIRKIYHLILLGRPTENVLLRVVNAYLPQPFVPDSDVLKPLAVDSVAFLPDPARDAGLLELTDSPWNENYSLLAVTGTTDEGVRLAVETLLKSPDALKGNLAVVEPAFLSGEPNQVRTYAIDTRPSTEETDANQPVSTGDISSETDLAIQAERWWK
jgi:hypothetical protein